MYTLITEWSRVGIEHIQHFNSLVELLREVSYIGNQEYDCDGYLRIIAAFSGERNILDLIDDYQWYLLTH